MAPVRITSALLCCMAVPLASAWSLVREGQYVCHSDRSQIALHDVTSSECRMSLDVTDACVENCADYCAGHNFADLFGSQCACFDECTMEDVPSPGTWAIICLQGNCEPSSVTTAAPSPAHHWLLPGQPDEWVVDAYLCGDDSSNQATTPSPVYDHDITVTCCNMAGTAGYRDCSWYPRTFHEAEQLCAGVGHRLCTLDEMEANVGASTGCLFDYSWNWVSTECTPSTDDEQASYHWTVVGRSQIGYTPQCMPDTATEANLLQSSGSSFVNRGTDDIGVSCCALDGSSGSRPGCHSAKTHPEAVQICADHGLRLCTRSELESDVTGRTGCSFDHHMNWVSDPCGSDTASASAISATERFLGDAKHAVPGKSGPQFNFSTGSLTIQLSWRDLVILGLVILNMVSLTVVCGICAQSRSRRKGAKYHSVNYSTDTELGDVEQ